MADCPTCDESFDTERGVKIHHSQSHGVSLKEYQEDRDWVMNEMNEEPVEETDIDRMVIHLQDTIKLTQEKFDLDTGLSDLEA